MSKIALVLLLACLTAGAFADAHEQMMKATFKIVGDSKKVEGSEESATAFAVALRNGKPGGGQKIALITVGHFFENVEGDRIDLVARRQYFGDEYERITYPIMLRGGETETLVRHPDPNIDAAAILIDWPSRASVTPLKPDQFATSAMLATAFGPGRTLHALGYPFGIESSPAGFPVLRNGFIASYPPPLRSDVRKFLVDMNMSHGYSGSPLYVADTRPGQPSAEPLVLGMIVGQHELTTEYNDPFEKRTVHHPLDLAIAIHGPAIRKLIQALPNP